MATPKNVSQKASQPTAQMRSGRPHAFPLPVYLLLAGLLAATLACTRSVSPLPTQNQTVVPPPTFSIPTVMPTLTPLPPSETPAASPTPETSLTQAGLSHTVQARVNVDAINLRVGPGSIFPVLAILPQNTSVVIRGKARGDEWVLAESQSGSGWLAAAFLEWGNPGPPATLPLVEMPPSVILQGSVKNDSNQPIDGVIVALTQKGIQNAPRTEARTQADGVFFIYLPHDTIGTWSVAVIAVDCSSSIVDADCQYNGDFSPTEIEIYLPDIPTLLFTYQQ